MGGDLSRISFSKLKLETGSSIWHNRVKPVDWVHDEYRMALLGGNVERFFSFAGCLSKTRPVYLRSP